MILRANALAIPLRDESVQCVCTSPPYWGRDWMVAEYINNQRSASDIAKQFGVHENNILYFIHKHGIKTRSVHEVRKIKKWGSSGQDNPMFGKFGPLNPHYKDGSSPERQRLYSNQEWKTAIAETYRRDGFKCVRCGKGKVARRGLHAHHIKAWAGNEDLRFDPTNIVTVCRECHQWIHSRANTDGDYIS